MTDDENSCGRLWPRRGASLDTRRHAKEVRGMKFVVVEKGGTVEKGG